MKKFIALVLIISTFAVFVPAHAEDKSLLMSVDTENIVRSVSENMFGVNSEWGSESENLYLDPNYGREQDFREDFESCLKTPAQTGEIYTWTSQTKPHTYIKNGGEYDGNASESTFTIDGDLYENQYLNGELQYPKQNIDSHADETNPTVYNFDGMLKNKLKIGGLPGWHGFSTRYEYLHIINNEDLQVVNQAGNKSLCLAPRNYSATAAPNGTASFFGKDNLKIFDGISKLSAAIKADNIGEGIRIHLIKNGGLNNVGDEWKRTPHGGQQTVWTLANNGKAEWLDIVTFSSNGSSTAGLYLGKPDNANLVCQYTIGTVIDLQIVLDFTDYLNPTITVTASGCTKKRNLADIVEETGGITAVRTVSNNIKKSFDCTTNGDYALLFSASTGKNYNDSAKVLLDNLEFASSAESEKVLNDNFINEMKNKGIRLWRFGGTTANYFKWKYTLGDIDERKPFSVNANVTPYVHRLGIVEGLKTALAINPDMNFSYVINFNDSIEDIRDLAEFLAGGADTEWGAKRAEYGIDKPINVVLWELGNELDKSGWTTEKYTEKCKEIISVLRKYTPDAKIGAIAATDLANYDNTAAGPDSWNIPVSTGLKGMVDCYAGHEYYRMDESDMLKKTDVFIDKLKKCDENLTFVAITEHASAECYNTETGKIEENLYYKDYSMGAVLQEAEFYNRNLIRPDGADLACYHSVKAGPWEMTYEQGREVYANAMADIMEMYSYNSVGNVLNTELEGFDSYISSKVTGAAVMDRYGNINVLLSNSDSAEKEVSISLSNDNYSPVKMTVICAENSDSYNGITQSGTVVNGIIKYDAAVTNGKAVLPPYSVVAVKFSCLMQIYEADFTGNSIRIDGTLGAESQNENVTLMINDLNNPETVYHIAQTETDSEGKFCFRFETDTDCAQCSVKINALGKVYDLTGKSRKITDVGSLFDVTVNTRYIDDTHALVTMNYDNSIIMPDVEYTAVFASYKNGRLLNTSISKGVLTERGEGQIEFEAEKEDGADGVKVFLWNSMKPMYIAGEENVR